MHTSEALAEAITTLARQRGADKTICPSEVARHVAGPKDDDWRPLMDPIKAVAIDLAHAGRIAIKQSDNLADPDRLTGIYRIAITDD